jgi:N-carbamoylputrescine amidase
VAAIQFAGSRDKEANVARAEVLVANAASRGAQVVCLQELFNTIYFCYEERFAHFDLAEPVPGPTIDRMSLLARDLGVVLIAPLFEKVHDGEYYNTAVVIDSDGGILGNYRKSQITHVFIDDYGASFYERTYFRPGNTGFRVFQTALGLTIGVVICGDKRFVEGPRTLGLNGAHVIFVPNTASSKQFKRRWDLEIRSQALLNMCYVVGANRVGYDEEGFGFPWFGSSMIVDPHGEVIAAAGDTDDEVTTAEIDPALVGHLRTQWGYFRERRPDLYGKLVE